MHSVPTTKPVNAASGVESPQSAGGSHRSGVPARQKPPIGWTLSSLLDSLPEYVDVRVCPELEAELAR